MVSIAIESSHRLIIRKMLSGRQLVYLFDFLLFIYSFVLLNLHLTYMFSGQI